MINKAIVLAILALWPASSLGRGIRTETGRKEGFWKQYSVVYGDIDCRWNTATGKVAVTLHVRATLSGSYDAAERPSVTSEIIYGSLQTAILLPPPPNAHAVVVLFRPADKIGKASSGQLYLILGDYFTFMPNWTAIQVVQGFEDPAVSRIVDKLREIRSGNPLSRDELERELREAWAAKKAQDAKSLRNLGIEELNRQAERLWMEYESLGRLDKVASRKKGPEKPSEAVGEKTVDDTKTPGHVDQLKGMIDRLLEQRESLPRLKKEASAEK